MQTRHRTWSGRRTRHLLQQPHTSLFLRITGLPVPWGRPSFRTRPQCHVTPARTDLGSSLGACYTSTPPYSSTAVPSTSSPEPPRDPFSYLGHRSIVPWLGFSHVAHSTQAVSNDPRANNFEPMLSRGMWQGLGHRQGCEGLKSQEKRPEFDSYPAVFRALDYVDKCQCPRSIDKCHNTVHCLDQSSHRIVCTCREEGATQSGRTYIYQCPAATRTNPRPSG